MIDYFAVVKVVELSPFQLFLNNLKWKGHKCFFPKNCFLTIITQIEFIENF